MADAVEQDFARVAALAEAVRWGPAVGDPPPEPPDYDSYTPPAHRTKKLELMHPHERDKDISFYETPHIYVVRGVPAEVSVTGVVGAYMEPFDARKTIAMMATGRREAWPRLKYAVDAQACAGVDAVPQGRTALLVAPSGKTLWAGVPPAGKADDAWALAMARKRDKSVASVEALAVYHCERAMTADEIEADWARHSTRASNQGTEAHLQMELFMNSEPTRACAELHNGLRFVAEHLAPLGVKAFRTEWEVHTDDDIGIAGSIDWVGQFENGDLIIVDWKRTGPDKHDIHDQWGKQMMHPLEHLDQCDICKFALQLSMYAHILETRYGFTVRALALVSIHPDHAFSTFVPFLETEVKFLCALRKERVAQKLCCENEFDLPRCELSERVAWQPVRTRTDNRLVDAQMAAWVLPETPTEPDAAAIAQIKAAEAKVTRAAPSKEEEALSKCRPWKARIPKTGWPEYKHCRSLD